MSEEITDSSLTALSINDKIFVIREQHVMIDKDLAELYGVETKVLNQAVKRNAERFPTEFRFQLTNEEKDELVTNCDRFRSLKHSSTNPQVFTEQGVAMLSAVLHSSTAVEISIKIIRAFVEMRKILLNNAHMFQKINNIELTQIKHIEESNKKFKILFDALEKNQLHKNCGIFYEGQIFDAYQLLSDIIRTANTSIIIIDNYLDDTVFKILEKKQKNVSVSLYTNTITESLQLDLDKFNLQYGNVELYKIKIFHDRFIIIDKKSVYHFGASLKDLGKKVFAFSKLNIEAEDLINKL